MYNILWSGMWCFVWRKQFPIISRWSLSFIWQSIISLLGDPVVLLYVTITIVSKTRLQQNSILLVGRTYEKNKIYLHTSLKQGKNKYLNSMVLFSPLILMGVICKAICHFCSNSDDSRRRQWLKTGHI